MRARAWLREPLLHFLILGAGLFVLYELVNGEAERAPEEIVIGAAEIAQLADGFTRTWQRPPTEQELAVLIDERVTEEVLYREALALGLERDDPIVRRRLRQKMEFLAQGDAVTGAPSEAELASFLREHAEKFAQQARLDFAQVYFSKERRGESAERDARALVERLNRDGSADLAALGDPLLVPRELRDRTPSEVERELGGDLAARLLDATPGRWEGPFASAYGLHVVLVRARVEPRQPELAEIRDDVEREWRAAAQARADAEWMTALRARYRVRVEPGDAPVAAR